MPEKIEKLRAALIELENELATLDTEDPATHDLLLRAKGDIESALLEVDHSNEIESETFIDQLTESERQFAASHPTLSGVVRRVIDVLAQMGI